MTKVTRRLGRPASPVVRRLRFVYKKKKACRISFFRPHATSTLERRRGRAENPAQVPNVDALRINLHFLNRTVAY